MSERPSLLVVILNYRTAEMSLRAAEAALAAMPATGDALGELVLVDNASGDGSAEMLGAAIRERDWQLEDRVRLVVSPRNGGFGAGNNLGIEAGMSDGSAPDFVYILNSDAFPDAGAIGALLAHLQANPGAGIAGSHVRGADDLAHNTAFRFPSVASQFEDAAKLGVITRLLRHRRVPMDPPHAAARVDWVAGASLMLHGKMLAQIGGFDETFFLYFEETDLCRRAAQAGWECWYVPDSRVVHIGSVSTGMKHWQRKPDYWYDSQRHYMIKHHGRFGFAARLAAHLVGSGVHVLRCALGGRTPQPPLRLGDLLRHAIKGPARLRADVFEDKS